MGGIFKQNGFEVKKLLLHSDVTDKYNPLYYLHNDMDIHKFAKIPFENSKNSAPSEALFESIVSYLCHYGKPEERNMGKVMQMLRSEYESYDTDSTFAKRFTYSNDYSFPDLMKAVKEKDPDSYVYKKYIEYLAHHNPSAVSIALSALSVFDITGIEAITEKDTLEIDGWINTVLFLDLDEETFSHSDNVLARMIKNDLNRVKYKTASVNDLELDTASDKLILKYKDVVQGWGVESEPIILD